MRIRKAEAHIEWKQDAISFQRDIEKAGRVCYKSEGHITENSYDHFLRMIIKNGHHSVLEHAYLTVRFVIDRGVSHELVRHRLCALSQESTRYCSYDKEQFGREITAIDAWPHLTEAQYEAWITAMRTAERAYFQLLDLGAKPEMARSVLPNSLKTEIVVTANIREWRHILTLRTSPKAHPQMREVMIPVLKELREVLPALFDDLEVPDEKEKTSKTA